ncbi:MAG: DNA repair protein RecN [Sporichthyaceae bacterium]
MIEELSIRSLGVIEDAVLPLGPGLTVLTGETGAGKTMVMTALGLLLGAKADVALVRTGSAQLAVEARIRVEAAGAVATRAIEAGADLDEDVLILARTVNTEGRSRAAVGGRSAPAALLTELGEDLVVVHGQHDQQRLLRPGRARETLDRFAGESVLGPLAAYRRAYEEYTDVTATLHEIATAARERAQEADLLAFGLAQIAALDPQPGEDLALAGETERLAHAEALAAGASTAHRLLHEDDDAAGVLTLVGQARRALEGIGAHDPVLAELGRRLAETSYVLADLAADLASYAASVEADPARLAAVQDRRAELGRLTRKYGATIDEVLHWATGAEIRHGELCSDADTAQDLTARQGALRADLTALAAEVSDARRKAAARLGKAVTTELVGLAMPHARIEVALRDRESEHGLAIAGRTLVFGPHGTDEVELLLSPHPGAPARPIGRGASGGELSRIMLAVQVVFAGADPVPTFVFDEVDAGVGGKAAVEVGRRLARLARSSQVLVVTHLPQVAAFADAHLLVAKSAHGAVTRTGVSTLTGEARLRELSRMLAGQEDSATARAHAQELLATAGVARGRTTETVG